MYDFPQYKDLVLIEQVLRTTASISAVDQLCQKLKLRARRRIYRIPVVIWLMIYQRLHPKGTLSQAVHFLSRQSVHWKDQPDVCKRISLQQISISTGGYCQARQKLPTLVASQVCDHIFAELQQRMRIAPTDLARPVFLIDGTTLRLGHHRELRRAFPPGQNQHGENHWPTMLLVAFHDALSGLAMRPSWGAMYGPHNTSEQALAREAAGRLPSDAVAMADSNFGVFWFAYEVQQTQRDVLLRLTRERSQKVLHGQALRPEFDREIERLLGVVARLLLPKRSGQRSYPREIWGRGGHFPFRRSPGKGGR